jgi:prolyl-tRNA editing enzyme YbaK/EbsC (Cys-tRNA(Pro) deacylase)
VDDIERRVRDTVAGIAGVEVIDCDPALADTADFCAAYGYAMEDSANAIVVIGKASNATVPPVYAACLVLATTRLDVNRVVRKRLGTKKASFAPPEATAELTGMTMGGVTPFALPDDLPLWIDRRVMDRARIVVGGGSRAAKVVGPPSMLLTIPTAEVVDELALLTQSGQDPLR